MCWGWYSNTKCLILTTLVRISPRSILGKIQTYVSRFMCQACELLDHWNISFYMSPNFTLVVRYILLLKIAFMSTVMYFLYSNMTHVVFKRDTTFRRVAQTFCFYCSLHQGGKHFSPEIHVTKVSPYLWIRRNTLLFWYSFGSPKRTSKLFHAYRGILHDRSSAMIL